MSEIYNENMVPVPEQKTERKKKPLWIVGVMAAAAVIALLCGYIGARMANEQAGKVVIQKVDTVSSQNSDHQPHGGVHYYRENGSQPFLVWPSDIKRCGERCYHK